MDPDSHATPETTTHTDAGGSWSPRGLLKFVLPSAVGVGMFLIPVPYGDTVTIGFGILAEEMQGRMGDLLPSMATGILCLSVVLTGWISRWKPEWTRDTAWAAVFDVGPGWFALRIAGAAFALMTLFQFGPEFIRSADTGGILLMDLAPVLLAFFFFAVLLLPFLVEFGFMEFVGTLVRRPFRVLFRLPGRSAIDATASWLGSGTVGVLITYQEYERGFYNQREASVIATNFSVVSVAFCVVVASFIGLGHMFVQFYLTVVAAGLVAALVVPRMPPLSRKSEAYYEPVGKRIAEEVPIEGGVFRHGVREAVARAERAPGPRALIRHSVFHLADIFFGLLPLVMAIGTVALVVAEYTPIFTWVSWPMVPVLEWLRIPEAQAVAPATVVGFADMFLPAVLLAGVESELTRFVVGALSLAQLIYLTEIGAIILKSRIPLSLLELAAIFVLRTAVTLPVIAGIAHLFLF